jgi:hypothetical protein
MRPVAKSVPDTTTLSGAPAESRRPATPNEQETAPAPGRDDALGLDDAGVLPDGAVEPRASRLSTSWTPTATRTKRGNVSQASAGTATS